MSRVCNFATASRPPPTSVIHWHTNHESPSGYPTTRYGVAADRRRDGVQSAWAFDGLSLEEPKGLFGLIFSIFVCVIVGLVMRGWGRGTETKLYRKESMAIVGLSWFLATFLGALPYVLSDTQREFGIDMNFADALFESQSGFSTTGATVLTDLENRDMVPRCILFWRSTTHFLGGLGIMVLFVAMLGQGSAGKALMRAEMPGPSSDSPITRMQHTAWLLCVVYVVLNIILTAILYLEGLSFFDAVCHAFGTMATGGFSTYNDSLGHFDSTLIEMTVLVFMLLAGTNFMLLYFASRGRLGPLLNDVEWRTYIGVIVLVTTAIIGFAFWHGDFDASEMAAGAEVGEVEAADNGDTVDAAPLSNSTFAVFGGPCVTACSRSCRS